MIHVLIAASDEFSTTIHYVIKLIKHSILFLNTFFKKWNWNILSELIVVLVLFWNMITCGVWWVSLSWDYSGCFKRSDRLQLIKSDTYDRMIPTVSLF